MRPETRLLLESLPTALQAGPLAGSLRISATFENGSLVLPLVLSEFRIPASSLGGLPARRSVDAPRAVAVLERIARELGLAEGRAQLVAEYQAPSRSLETSLRWIDVSWPGLEDGPPPGPDRELERGP